MVQFDAKGEGGGGGFQPVNFEKHKKNWKKKIF